MRSALLWLVAGLAGLAASVAFAAGPRANPSYFCHGSIVEVFAGSGTGAVVNGGKPPTFSTKGQAYCVTSVQTYHWNNGKGQAPGTIALRQVSGPAGFDAEAGPFKAMGSAGQNGAPNVNWQVTLSTAPAPDAVIDGTYQCIDSSPATWSTATAGGPGFCNVYGLAASPNGNPAPTTSTSKHITFTIVPSLVVEPGHKLELVVKNTSSTAIEYFKYVPVEWKLAGLGKVASFCDLVGGSMVCDKGLDIGAGQTFSFTITDWSGTPGAGKIWVNGSPTFAGSTGPVTVAKPAATKSPAQTQAGATASAYAALDDRIAATRTKLEQVPAGASTDAVRASLGDELKRANDIVNSLTVGDWQDCGGHLLGTLAEADGSWDDALGNLTSLPTNGDLHAQTGVIYAHVFLLHATTFARTCEGVPDSIRNAVNELEAAAGQLSDAVSAKTKTGSEVFSTIRTLEARKHAMLKTFPPAAGVPSELIVKEQAKIQELFFRARSQLSIGKRQTALEAIDQIVRHKQLLERAFRKAA